MLSVCFVSINIKRHRRQVILFINVSMILINCSLTGVIILILWTIQSYEAWQNMQEVGYLRGYPEHVEEDWLSYYQWMILQMHLRIKAPSYDNGSFYPVWAWHQWQNDKQKKPDLRYSAYLKRGEKGVLIEFEADQNSALLSDFELWHYVMNYWYLASSLQEMEQFEEELKKNNLSFYKQKPLPNKEFHIKIVHSWEKIFDLDWVDDEEEITRKKNDKSIQATLWEVRLEQVRSVREFVAR